MKRRAIFLTVSMIFSITFLQAQEATAWRNGTDGIYAETELLDEWPVDGPDVIWTYEELGRGHASVAIQGDYLYTTGMTDEGEGFLFKFSKSGDLVYKKSYGAEYNENFHGPRGTPVIAGDKIYYISGYGELLCLNEEDASVIWSKDLVNDFGGDTIRWGYNETPVIDGDVMYATPGGPEHNVVALNRHSGDLIWSVEGRQELSAYCTPLLFDHNGRKILATHTESNLMGIDAEAGKLLWVFPFPNKWSVHANTPIYRDGKLFIMSGYGLGSVQLALNAEGTSVKQTWGSVLDSRMGGAVYIDGYLYGSGDKYRDWRCIDWKTGEDVWTSDSIAKGVVIAADDKLYCYTDRGELAIVKASSESFELLEKVRMTYGSEQHWAHPAISGGVMYVRHGKGLAAYKIK